jgi:hypothetical protein
MIDLVESAPNQPQSRKGLKGQVFADDEKIVEMKLQGNKHNILDSLFECSKKICK